MNNNTCLLSLKSQIIFEFIKDIKDPERDCTIEDLDIINENSIEVNNFLSYDLISIKWKPTSPNCSFAVNIGLCIRYKLKIEILSYIANVKALKRYKYKLDIIVEKGSHVLETEINKQVNDKERYSAALECPNILQYIKNLVN